MYKRILLVLYLKGIALVSLIPSGKLPYVELFPYSAKLIHCGMYAGLTFLIFWNWPERFTEKMALIPMIAIMLLGFSMEVSQSLFDMGRTFDLWDQFSNMLGYFPGWIFWIWVQETFYSFPCGVEEGKEIK